MPLKVAIARKLNLSYFTGARQYYSVAVEGVRAYEPHDLEKRRGDYDTLLAEGAQAQHGKEAIEIAKAEKALQDGSSYTCTISGCFVAWFPEGKVSRPGCRGRSAWGPRGSRGLRSWQGPGAFEVTFESNLVHNI